MFLEMLDKFLVTFSRDSDADKLTDNLWFELKTTNLNGEESTYRVQLETTEITKEVKK